MTQNTLWIISNNCPQEKDLLSRINTGAWKTIHLSFHDTTAAENISTPPAAVLFCGGINFPPIPELISLLNGQPAPVPAIITGTDDYTSFQNISPCFKITAWFPRLPEPAELEASLGAAAARGDSTDFITEKNSAEGSDRRISILIVEDDLITASYLKKRLEQEGYRIPAIINTGEKAVTYCSVTPPDVIIMDIQLAGEISGIEAAKRIKAQQDIPLLYASGNAEDYSLVKAQKTTPVGFIIKPIDVKKVTKLLEGLSLPPGPKKD